MKINKILTLFLILFFFGLAAPKYIIATDGILQFKSGFEGTTKITGSFDGSATDNWIEGIDGSLGDWTNLKTGNYSLLSWVKQAYGYFEGGRMDIVNDPTGANNHVLRLQNGSGGTRSQWQFNQVIFWKDDGVLNKFDKQFYRYRMYIPSDITTVFGYDVWSEWYMIWENHTWEQYANGNMTRNGIYLQKNPNSNLWYFRVYQARPGGCENYVGPTSSCENYWDNKNYQNIPVPFDQWFTLDVYFKYSGTDGEWYVAITKEGQSRQEIAHYIGPTQFNNEKLHDQMIIKMYHDSRYSSTLGQTNQYYDDLEIWGDYPPGYFSNITPSPAPSIQGDIVDNSDTVGDEVNIFDFNALVSVFGTTGTVGWIKADIIKNGAIDIFDFNKVVENFNL